VDPAKSSMKNSGKRDRRTATGASDKSVISVLLFKGPDPFPNAVRKRFRYAETYAFTTGAAGIAGTQQAMGLNTLFDPNVTGVGHQPYGFDQFAAFYGKYRVDRVTVDVLWNTIGSTAEVACLHILQPPSGGITLTGVTTDRAAEIPQVLTCVLSPSGNTRTQRIRFSCSCAELCGVSQQKYEDDPNYSALISANPSLLCYLNMAISSYSGSAGEAATAQVVIEFEAYMWERIVQAQS